MALETPLPDVASLSVRDFSAWLAARGQGWLVLSHEAECIQLCFTGPFEGGDVIWHCEFVTLAREWRGLCRGRTIAPVSLRNFIEVGEPREGHVPLRVGLALKQVDERAVRMMVHMIRQYRNLRRGRHEYGTPFTP
ncbi:MAG TPA: hypothetical protein ENJ79_02865 [Gammaproteobacteria bacterium]|nr:hypothetical protein [Gammaproteobacteria bacterium]